MSEIKNVLEEKLNQVEFDNSIERAEIARLLVKQIYNFVKFNRPEGEGLDGRDGPERQSLAKIVDAAENHYYKMLEIKHRK